MRKEMILIGMFIILASMSFASAACTPSCASGQVCSLQGTCVSPPTSCLTNYDPVCCLLNGKNQTASNACRCNSLNGDVQYAGVCKGACTPETAAAFCKRLGKTCGAVTANDNCGTSRTVATCGSCAAGQSCNSTGQCTTAAPVDVPEMTLSASKDVFAVGEKITLTGQTGLAATTTANKGLMGFIIKMFGFGENE